MAQSATVRDDCHRRLRVRLVSFFITKFYGIANDQLIRHPLKMIPEPPFASGSIGLKGLRQ
jgi:hypothetical protein